MTSPDGRNRVDAQTVIAKGKDHVEALADGEVVLMHVEDGRFYSLAGTGRRVWEMLEAPTAIGVLADRLVEEFEVSKEDCVRDLIALCEQLEAGRVIRVAD